jgi:Zn-dependent peptidase ImmA (M78 family)
MKPIAIPSEIKLNAYDFRIKNAISEIEPINCKTLLFKLKILTVYRSLPDRFSGMCLKKEGEAMFILVNSRHPRGKQHFTIAHELFHLYFQKELKPHLCNPGNSSLKDQDEWKADLFAAELLMPEVGLLKMIPPQELSKGEISVGTLLALENYYRVSHSALILRLFNLGFIKESHYNELAEIKIIRSARIYGFPTALYEAGNEGEVIGDYAVLANKLFDENKISESHYYELLRKINIEPASIPADE